MNSLKAMYGCGLNFFIKLAYNSLFLYKFALFLNIIYFLLCTRFFKTTQHIWNTDKFYIRHQKQRKS